jgi:hypothetical protein
MKRIDENVSVTLPPVRLYIEDLDQVVETVSKQDRVEITHGRVLYDSLAELRGNLAVESLRSLQIYVSARAFDQWGSLTIRFEPSKVEIRGSEVMSERAAAAAVFLSRQTPWYSWYPTNHLPLWQGFFGALWTTALALAGAAMYLGSDWTTGPLLFVYLGFLFVGYAVLFSDVHLGATRIFLYSRHGKPTFWQKNKDAILVAVIAALVSGAVGFVLGRITGTPPVH